MDTYTMHMCHYSANTTPYTINKQYNNVLTPQNMSVGMINTNVRGLVSTVL
jgi:hypothetical protein